MAKIVGHEKESAHIWLDKIGKKEKKKESASEYECESWCEGMCIYVRLSMGLSTGGIIYIWACLWSSMWACIVCQLLLYEYLFIRKAFVFMNLDLKNVDTHMHGSMYESM